ncbi:hypothetical protein BKA80DRAFT_340893 [Phyllosticta citrichinensis]
MSSPEEAYIAERRGRDVEDRPKLELLPGMMARQQEDEKREREEALEAYKQNEELEKLKKQAALEERNQREKLGIWKKLNILNKGNEKQQVKQRKFQPGDAVSVVKEKDEDSKDDSVYYIAACFQEGDTYVYNLSFSWGSRSHTEIPERLLTLATEDAGLPSENENTGTLVEETRKDVARE